MVRTVRVGGPYERGERTHGAAVPVSVPECAVFIVTGVIRGGNMAFVFFHNELNGAVPQRCRTPLRVCAQGEGRSLLVQRD